MMTPVASHAELLHQYATHLYRLAIYLTHDEAQAEQALVRLAGQHSQPAANRSAADLPTLLLAVLPPERKLSRRLPAWASSAEPHSAQAQLLAALAQLPRRQRLALLPTPIRIDPDAPLTDDERATRRLALLTLAPVTLAATLTDQNAPVVCQAARMALTLDDPVLHTDPAVRGHLALCEECRAAANRWNQLARLVDDALRSSLRPLEMPGQLQQRMLAAALPQQPRALQGVVGPWVRRAMLPVLILATIAAIIWPRNQPAQPAQINTAPVSMPELVAAAQANLYKPPGSGVWVERYAMRWNFPDGSYAPLIGTIWRDMNGGRVRLELAHQAGGGPYQFLLGNGANMLWVALTPTYAEAAGLLLSPEQPALLAWQATPEQIQEAATAQLRTGAWRIAETYLRQANTAPLQNWGSLQDQAGNPIEVIGFQAPSPLVGQPGTPGADGQPVTILLHIRTSDQQLVEVRELIGPAGGEQVSRTTWQALGREELTDYARINQNFNLREAYRGTGEFEPPYVAGLMPNLPYLSPDLVFPPILALYSFTNIDMELLATIPPNVTSATILMQDFQPGGVAYLGNGSSLTMRSLPNSPANQAQFSSAGTIEERTIGERPSLLHQLAAERYSVLLRPPATQPERPLVLVEALGYDHDELLRLLSTIRPLDIAAIRDQYALFGGQPGLEPLLDALLASDTPPPGQLRYQRIMRYMRQNPNPPVLNDPYHYPPNGGRPDTMVEERWITPLDPPIMPSDVLFLPTLRPLTSITYRLVRDQAGTIYERSYIGASDAWEWWQPEQRVEYGYQSLSGSTLEPEITLRRMLTCGATVIAEQATARIYSLAENDVCFQNEIGSVVTINPTTPASANQSFYMADLTTPDMMTWLTVQDGQVQRIDLRAGSQPDGLLLYSWELELDELHPASTLPQDLSALPPPALFSNSPQAARPASSFGTLTTSAALALVQTPLLLLPAIAPLDSAMPPITGATWYGTTVVSDQPLLTRSSAFSLDYALWRGQAVQLEVQYMVPGTADTEVSYIYQGRADTLRTFLQTSAILQSSTPITLRIANRDVAGWIIRYDDTAWAIGEINGTLIAFRDNGLVRNIIAEMELLEP